MNRCIDHTELDAAIRRCCLCKRYLCEVCRRAIPKAHKARYTTTGRIACLSCHGRQAHAIAYPECEFGWHDMADHGGTFATPGGLRRLISEAAAS